MTEPAALVLESRAVLCVTGMDSRDFLQGMISNDIGKLTPERAIWAAFLTPQGKFLHEFFLCLDPRDPQAILIDCEAARLNDLKRRLSLYKLRSKVEIEDAGARYAVAALFGAGTAAALALPETAGAAAPLGGGLAYMDPRLPDLGARAVLPRGEADAALKQAGFTAASPAAYDRLRMSLGVPDGSRDLEVERSPLLENGFDELNGVDWDKGCFMGQELTARTKYRALIKKRLMPVEIDGPTPAPGTPILRGGKDLGTMRSGLEHLGLALLRLDALESSTQPLMAGEAKLIPKKMAWARF